MIENDLGKNNGQEKVKKRKAQDYMAMITVTGGGILSSKGL